MSKPYVCTPDGYLEPKIGASGFAAKAATTVPALFSATAKKHATLNAMALKRPVGGVVPDKWKFWTWKEYHDDCIKFAKTLLHLGVDKWNVVNILGFNSVSSHQQVINNFNLNLTLIFHLIIHLHHRPSVA